MPRGRNRFRWPLVLALTALGLAACRKPAPPVVVVSETPTPLPTRAPTPTPTPTPTPPPEPTPPPPPYVPAKRLELGKIFNGIQYRVHFETERGRTATLERNDPASYVAELTLKVKVPKPHRSLEELSKLNKDLGSVLPALPAMLEKATVATAFEDLYRRKCAQIQGSINRLDAVLSRHNFFDCETVLELQHPETKRRAILIQADMDTDMDGSDPDRVPEIDGSSATFQPMTSYRWAKKSTTINSFIPPLEAKIKAYDAELALAATAAARKVQLKSDRDDARIQIADLKASSFLVARTDPFIVLPTPMVTKTGPFAPLIGDYCVVIHEGTLYPAIVGDAGPTTKMGEASLRICKEIEPNSSAVQRAENDLKVTYLVFPGTRERPFQAPDLEKWRARCETLLGEFGGSGGVLFKWADLAKPPAPATPAPAPATPAPTTPAPSTPAPEKKPAAGQ
jgi:hypothetical protein